MLLVSCIFVFFILPGRLNKLDTESEQSIEDQENNSQNQAKTINFSMFLFNVRTMLAVVSSTIAMVFMLFYNSILSVQLESMGVSEDNVGMSSLALNKL